MDSDHFNLQVTAQKRPTHHLGCSSVNNKYVIVRVQYCLCAGPGSCDGTNHFQDIKR